MFEISLEQSFVVLYFLLTLFLGFYRKSNNNVNSFLFAGRKLTVPALVATLVSTWYGGILEVGRFTYENGIVTWIIFGVFYYVAALLFIKYIAPKIVKEEIPTIPELFLTKFGQLPAIIALFCIVFITSPAPYLKILGQLFKYVWDIPFIWALLLGTSLSIVYALFGGFSAIVRTDKFQFILMFLGFGVILFYSYYNYGGLDFLLINTPQYAFSIPGNFNWTFVFVWGFIALITFIDPSFYQRTFSGNSLQSVQKGILISIGFWIIFDFMTIFTGLYALAILPSIESSPFLDLSEIVLPPFARGLFIVSLFAIVASTIDSFTFISAYTLGRDLPIVLRLEISKMDAINHTRIGLFITTIISIILAIYFKNAVDIWYLVGSFTTPTLLIPLLCALYGIKLKYTSFVLILPLLASIGWYLHGVMNLSEEGFPVYLFNLDPMYPGIILSVILYYFYKEH